MAKYTVILTHAGADLDAISSMYAAGKLYPGAFLIHPGSLDVSAKKLTNFFGEMLNFIKLRELPNSIKNNIGRIIIVDTKIYARLGEGKELLKNGNSEIIIFDHHPQSENDIKNAKIIHMDVGANTTILVNLLKRKKTVLNSFEATLLALGIYEDTGSFMFPGVTPEDFEAIAFLSIFGINMQIIRRFVSPFLSKPQVELLKSLISNVEEVSINGMRISIATATMKRYVQSLSVVTHRLREIIDSDFLFVIVRSQNGIFVMGRSNAPEYNVKEILLPIGGGGHYNAATAFVKSKSVEEIKSYLINKIQNSNYQILKAKYIMSYPVKMIDAKTGIKEALNIMVKMGFSGLPVTENNKVIGIISKRDIEKIMMLESRNRPVKQYLSPNVFVVEAEDDLRKVENIMATNNVGRVLVKENGEIVGIISRSDLLKAYFIKNNRINTETPSNNLLLPSKEEVKNLIKATFPKDINELLHLIGEVAEQTGQRVYLVGGAVRDLFLGVKSLDFDFVLTKDATTFGKILEGKVGEKIKIYEEFNTAHLVYKGYHLDFVTARREYYNKNSVLPIVEKASLKEDLGRRDFTINAMAISVMPGELGLIIDFYNGFSDLERKTIRTLSTISFIEDPSRLLRAIKYEVKLGFKLAPETEFLFNKAVELGVLTNKRSSRITNELIELLSADYTAQAIEKMEKRGILKIFFNIKHLSKAKKTAIKIANKYIKEFSSNPLYTYLLILMHNKKESVIIKKLERIDVKKKIINKILKSEKEIKKIKTILKKKDAFELFKILRHTDKSLIAGIIALISNKYREEVAKTVNRAYNTRNLITGKDLKEIKLKEGKQYQEIFDEIAYLHSEGKVHSKKDAISYIIKNKERYDWNERTNQENRR